MVETRTLFATRHFVTTQHIKAGWQEMSARSADIGDLFDLLAQRFLPAVVTHLVAFFRCASVHFTRTTREPFNFIKASRFRNPVPLDLDKHLSNFLNVTTVRLACGCHGVGVERDHRALRVTQGRVSNSDCTEAYPSTLVLPAR